MTSLAIAAGFFVAGYIVGVVMGVWIGVEYNQAPLLDDPKTPAIIDMEYIDTLSGEGVHSSTSIVIVQFPDGRRKQIAMENN